VRESEPCRKGRPSEILDNLKSLTTGIDSVQVRRRPTESEPLKLSIAKQVRCFAIRSSSILELIGKTER
ncbi:MAG: hypothetical protein ACK50J_22840, partial [Planctomyces sp.]